MVEPVRPIVVSGSPPWAAAAEAAAQEAGYAIVTYAATLLREALVARLAQERAALLLVDGALPAWRAWVAAARTSPATRRMPVAVVAQAGVVLEAEARDAGADAVLVPDALGSALPRLLATRAAETDSERLACQCGEPLPPEGLEAIRLFNAGEYYRQHDLFEALWMATEGPVRDLYRGILQVGVAYHHLQRGNLTGAYKMLLRSIQWLAPLPDVCQGVDVAQLRADSREARLKLEAILASGGRDASSIALCPVKLVNDTPA